MKKEKSCKACGKVKSIEFFNPCGKYHSSYCKPCQAIGDKKYRLINSDKIKARNHEKYWALSSEQKKAQVAAKKYIVATCSVCETEFRKRKDTLKNWGGLCVVCARKEVANRPEVIEANKKNGLDFIARFGRLAGPKMENRRRGKTHHNFGSFKENNVNWIKDRSQLRIQEDRRGACNKFWKDECKERDGKKCRIGNADCRGQLEVHHILPWRDYPELRHDLNNGITLCSFHHPRKYKEEKRLAPYFQELVKIKIA